MTAFALGLVLAAAFIHASWNFLAKRAGGGAAFVWLFAALSAIFYAPLAVIIYFWQKPYIGPMQIVFMAGSSLIHLAYFLILQRGYRVGDLSLVYPLARGTGPTLSTFTAILVLGERPTSLAIFGALLVAAGVFLLSSGPGGSSGGSRKWGVGYGLLTGTIIAMYTLWDKYAVSTLLIPPLLQDFCTTLGRVILLAPIAFRKREEVRQEWRIHRKEAIGVALLCPLSYIMVLTALMTTPVSYIAPAREVSILIGALMGSRLLAEGDAHRRLPAAAAIVAGVMALALG